MPSEHSTDVLAEQIKNIVEAIGRIEAILLDMQKNYTSREEVRSMIKIHATEDDLKFEKIGNDLRMLQKVIWGVVSAMVAVLIGLAINILNSLSEFIHFG